MGQLNNEFPSCHREINKHMTCMADWYTCEFEDLKKERKEKEEVKKTNFRHNII